MIPKILTNCFKNNTKVVSKILSTEQMRSPRFFQTTSKTTQKRSLRLFSNYFKPKTEKVTEILSNYFKNKSHRRSSRFFQISYIVQKQYTGISPRFFETNSKSGARLLQTSSKIKPKRSLGFFQTTSKTRQKVS